MTTLREAAQQALEALKRNHYAMIDAGMLDQNVLNQAFTAHEALRAALAAPVQEPVAWFYWGDNYDGTESEYVHIGREFPAYRKPIRPPTPLYTAPPQRKPLRTLTYVCPVCAASLERQE